ncbi:MAG: SPFH domain-containing protein [Desulfatiglans sp.]|jgi:regulator of protease activity HflC (stomatin/prohibitin superfamily)|nr:SPFH domain-containing protein [Desulfatiglans sp.]
MFGIKFIKMQPTDYVIQYRKGKIVREGTGLFFFYYAPFSSLVRISVASIDAPFIFKEVTIDFQEVTVQGQITYRVSDPMKLSRLMNFTLGPDGKNYTSEDPDKLPQRLINHAQVLTRDTLKAMTLKEALKQAGNIVIALREGFKNAETITNLGIEVVDLSILAIKPTPETSRALEAEAREQILKEADDAIYSRRNSAVEQERTIKENELNTEIAVENKKRQIKETQMDAEKSVQQKRREIKEAEMAAKISLEEKNKELVALATENTKHEADTKAYSISVMMKAISGTDPKVIQSLASAGMDPSQLVAFAFKELAESASKIGQLNISPELLRELMAKQESK